ncbi:MAG: S8 family peptidase [Bacteroidota bacterium]
MKKILLLSFLLNFILIQAQNKCSNITRIDLNQIQKAIRDKENNPLEYLNVMEKYPINTLNGQKYLSVLAKVNSSFSSEDLIAKKYLVGKGIKQIRTLKIPLNEIGNINSITGLEYYEIAGKISPSLDKAIKDIHADSVQKGINLPEAYTGKDVLIGITDWGFDYTHPNFYDTLLSQTRILAAWDQYKQSGPSPSGYSYGTEFSTVNDLLAAQSDTSNIYGYGIHGTHVAGITGGSGAGTPFRGVAFEANFLFATFLIDATSVLDAYEWMYQKSLQEGKRLVINQSWGLHWIGNLDGTSLLSQAIDSYSNLGVTFVSSAGNNGDVNFHLSKTFANDDLRSKVVFYNYGSNPNMWGQSLSLWGEATKNFSVGIQILNGANDTLAETPYYATNTTPNYIDSTLIVGLDTVFFNVSAEQANPLNNRPHARFRVKNKKISFKIIMKVKAIDGTVHCWNVTELTTDVGNWGMSFASNAGGIVAGDHNYGISEPACTNSTIAVAAYESIGTGTGTAGNIAPFSSFGPTLDERIKPDISAPGVNVGSSFSSFTDETFTAAQTVQFNGRTYPFAKISGTSMSGPIVTGVVALILDANPYLTPAQIKEIIKTTAREDNFTSPIPTEGSVRWGAGKINAYKAIQLALQTIGTLENTELKNENLNIYPNPSAAMLNIGFEENMDGKTVSIIDFSGKEVKMNVTKNVLDISKLSAGTYLLRFESKGKIVQEKFIKE